MNTFFRGISLSLLLLSFSFCYKPSTPGNEPKIDSDMNDFLEDKTEIPRSNLQFVARYYNRDTGLDKTFNSQISSEQEWKRGVTIWNVANLSRHIRVHATVKNMDGILPSDQWQAIYDKDGKEILLLEVDLNEFDDFTNLQDKPEAHDTTNTIVIGFTKEDGKKYYTVLPPLTLYTQPDPNSAA